MLPPTDLDLTPKSWAAFVSSLPGKHVGESVYLHGAMLQNPAVPKSAQTATKFAASIVGEEGVEKFNIIKFSRRKPTVSLLSYPSFWRAAFPALQYSWTVDLATGKVSRRDFSKYENKPILHRKELFILPDHPDYAKFSKLTQQVEALGLFHDTKRIGNQLTWTKRLAEAGLRVSGNKVVPIAVKPVSGHSERTARPIRPQLHRVLMEAGEWEDGDVNVDVGGGPYEYATEYLRQHKVGNFVHDPYNRSATHNRGVATIDDADTATIANVLNVIQDREERLKVLRRAANFVKPGGRVFVWVHEGDKTGRGRVTRDGWQENRKTESYIQEVREIFPEAHRRGRIITAVRE